jgi:putative salt-induced outer membrane protein YdiY
MRLLESFPRVGIVSLWTVLITCGAPVVAAAQDVLTSTTGDRLVGEIQSLERDVLTFSTPYSDSDFKIEWSDVASLESARQFLVETFSGQRLSGTLKADLAQKATVLVGSTSVPLAEISIIQPFERSLWSRFDTSLDFGYSMVQANLAKQLNLGSTLGYRDEKNVDSLFATVFFSSQDNAPDTQRWELGNDYRYLLGQRWYVNTTQDFVSSDEQGLTLRTTIGGGGGRYLLRSSSQYLALGGGLAWTKEDYQDPAVETQDSAEAYIGTEFMTEKMKFADLLTRLTYYPSLTIDDRYRINYKFDLDFNLPGDWYFRIGFFENYDSQPPSDLSKNDWGWSNAFGFKF